MRGQRRGWCGRFSHPRGLMFFYEGIGLISLGLFSWIWAYAGPPQASPVQFLHMKPLLHIYVIPQQHSPTSSHLSPFSSSPSPLLFQMQNKHQASLLHHFRARQHRVWAECSSGYLGAFSTLVLLNRPCSMQEWFSPICPMFEEEKGRVNAFQIVFIWGLILSHLLAELKVFTQFTQVCFKGALVNLCLWINSMAFSVGSLQVSMCLCIHLHH